MTLQEKYDALETKHKNLRGSISWLAQELRELEGPTQPHTEGEVNEELDTPTSWPEVPSFGIYMQLLQALMGAKPPVVGGETDVTIAIKEQKYTDRKKKFKVLD
jgi:hypothetical protein